MRFLVTILSVVVARFTTTTAFDQFLERLFAAKSLDSILVTVGIIGAYKYFWPKFKKYFRPKFRPNFKTIFAKISKVFLGKILKLFSPKFQKYFWAKFQKYFWPNFEKYVWPKFQKYFFAKIIFGQNLKTILGHNFTHARYSINLYLILQIPILVYDTRQSWKLGNRKI